MLEDQLKDIKKAIDVKRAEAQTAKAEFEKAKAKLKDNPDVDITNPEDPAVVAADEAMKPWSQAQDDLRVLQGQFERIAMMDAAGGGQTVNSRERNEIDRHPQEARQSVGQLTARGEAYRELVSSGALADGSQQSVGRVQIGEPMGMRQFASLLTGTSDSAGGALITPERIPGVYDLPQLPLNIMQLLTIGETSSSGVEFMRLLARTINAAEVAEASSTADIGDGTGGTVLPAAGGRKPESGLTWEEALEAVRTIAHTMPATRNQLADAPFLRTLVDAEMTTGVERRAESQILSGNGTAPNLRGILSTAGRAQYTQGADNAGEPRADAVHRIFTMLRLAGFSPSAYATNPLDWQEIRLSKDDNNNYIWGPPSQAGGNQIWGVTAVETIGLPEGTGVAGEWKRALFLVREAVRVFITDSHNDWFVRNILMLLAEARGVLVIPRPQAFGEVTFA